MWVHAIYASYEAIAPAEAYAENRNPHLAPRSQVEALASFLMVEALRDTGTFGIGSITNLCQIANSAIKLDINCSFTETVSVKK